MSNEANEAIVRRFLARIRDGHWDDSIMGEFFAPTYRRHLTPTTPPLTAQEQQERAMRLRVAFPDADATLEEEPAGAK